MKNTFTRFSPTNPAYRSACLLGLALGLMSALSVRAQTVYGIQEQAGSYSWVAPSAGNSVPSTGFSLALIPPLAQPPLVSATASQSALCVGSTTGLTAQVSGGTAPYTYQWSSDSPGVLSYPTAKAVIFTATSAGPVSVSVVVTDANNLTDTATVSLTVNALPEPPSLLSLAGQAYPGGVASLTVSQNSAEVVLTVSGCAGGTINWSGGSGSTLRVSTNTPGSFTYWATCEQAGCSSAAARATVVVTQQLAQFWLINADTDQPIQELTAGTQLNLASLPTRNLNIQALTEPAVVGSVAFSLSGQQTYQGVERVAPYALFGDNQGDYQSWTPAVGTYALTAIPYAGAKATGTAGTALTVAFTVVDQPDGQPLTHFWLINADTDQPIQELTDGQEVDLSRLPTRNLNIQAVTEPAVVDSVIFELSGRQTRRQVEEVAPYALFGDTQGDNQGWTPEVGSYTLVATPYWGVGGTDTAGMSRRICFVVTNPGAARLAAGRVEASVEGGWQVRVLGNPVTGSEVVVEVNGAQGQPLHYELLDGSGRLVQTQQVEQAGWLERHTMNLGSQRAGVLLLRVSTPTHSQTVKILKQ
ncbi:T9SS type A sorting domain-containing protein [Spirosoma pulveris]